MKSLLIIAILLVVYTNALTVSYSGNVSSKVDVSGNGWSYRAGALYDLDVAGLYESTQYLAISAHVGNGDAEVEVMAGGLAIVNDNFPYVFTGSYDGSAQWSTETNFLSGNVNASEGIIVSSYLWLVEKDSNGNVVANVSLVQHPDPILAIWQHTEATTSNGGLHYTTFTATPASTWSISLTLVASNVVGKINYGGAVVTPSSLETIVSIQGYPYASATNTLTLVMAVASGSASFSENGAASGVQSGSGNGQVFFSLSKSFLNGGEVHPASVSAFTNGDFSDVAQGQYWQGQVSGKYSAQAALQFVTVQFAAGATDIVYDPSVGTGTNTMAADNGGPVTMVSFLVLAVSCLAMLF